jgi:hypothetical protein
MSLEKELVLTLIKEGNTFEDVEKITSLMADPTLESPYKPLKLDKKKIKVELRRQYLLSKYNKSNKKDTKKIIRKNIEEKIYLMKQYLMEDSLILEIIKTKKILDEYHTCDSCKTKGEWVNLEIEVKKLIKTNPLGENGLLKTKMVVNPLEYCMKCGYITYNNF